jgi:hypothetical protein
MTNEGSSQENLTCCVRQNVFPFCPSNSASKANNPGLQSHGRRLTKGVVCECGAVVSWRLASLLRRWSHYVTTMRE